MTKEVGLTREEAVSIATQCAMANPEEYVTDGFVPHEWVVDAVQQAGSGSHFNAYQAFTAGKAAYNENVFYHVEDQLYHAPWTYPVAALAEEAGEVNGKVAKFVRKSGTDREALATAVLPELGDVLFNVSEAARMFGFTLQEVVDYNVDKLTDREDRGVLIGSGDHR